MCGICCSVKLSPSDLSLACSTATGQRQQQLEAELNAGLDLIGHRGPDARGHWISKNADVGFAHCRLSINDLRDSSSQPLHSDCNTIHAVVNGEIYDFDRLRADLADQFQYPFQTQTDSEVVIALYKRDGLDFFKHLRGEFAICIYDETRQLFLAIRDRYGIKPLFWTIHDGQLLVAAEAKTFLGFGWKPEWDVASIVEGGWNFDDRTLFKGVEKAKPGHYLICDSSGLRQECYWDMQYPDKSQSEPRTEEEMIVGVRESLLEAVRLRLRADVPVGIYLSGGIDSSVIAGMVNRLVREKGLSMGSNNPKERICCFSIAFEKTSGYDESDISERTADWLGVRYLKKLMNEEELANRFEDATWHCEHHNYDLNYIGKFALSELPEDTGYKVVLTGEGADENFAGYPTYLPDFLREPDHSGKFTTLSDSERKRFHAEKEAEVAEYYASVGAEAFNRAPSAASRALNGISTPASMSAFQSDYFTNAARSAFSQDSLTTIAKAIPDHVRSSMMNGWHPLHSALYAWSKGHLTNNFLSCLGDRTEMAHSIEARTPFLDHHLTEYVNGLPPSVKIRYSDHSGKPEFTEKWILREAARPFITDELYKRKKFPYSAPTVWPKEGPIHKLFQRLLTEENVEKLGFVDWQKAKDNLKNAFEKGDVRAMRGCYVIGQWVVIGGRFGIPEASLECENRGTRHVSPRIRSRGIA